MKTAAVCIAGLLAAAGLTSIAHADNTTTPLQCKSEGYPGPTIKNTSGHKILKGKRLRWQKTTNGPGNSTGEIRLAQDMPKNAKVRDGEDLGSSKCTAVIDKLRVDLWVKSASQPAPGKVKIKLANGDEWRADKAKVQAKIFACGATVASHTVTSDAIVIDKGAVETVTLSYPALPGGKATVELTADPNGHYDEISEWNNRTSVSNCPCGGAQTCGDGDPACGGGHHCDAGCCVINPPG